MMVFEILPSLVLSFVVGRIWQVRRDELDRRRFKGVARIPRLQKPHLAGGTRLQHVAARGACFDVGGIPHE